MTVMADLRIGVKDAAKVETDVKIARKEDCEAMDGEARLESKSWGAVMGAYCAPYSTSKVYSFPLSLDNKEPGSRLPTWILDLSM